MRTRIVKENGVWNVYHDSTNTLLGSRDDHEEAKALANTLRGVVKAEAAKTKIAELGADGGSDDSDDNPSSRPNPDLLILGFGGEASPITADLKFFEDEIAELSSSPLLDSHGNEVPRTYREGFVLRPGEFIDANGREVRITPEHIQRIHRNHDPSYPPQIQLQHRRDPRDTQGYVPLTTVHGTGDATELHVALEFRGSEAVSKAEAGLYRDLSAGINMRTWTLEEVSVVGKGAVGATGGKRAQIKFAANNKPGQPPKGEKTMSFWQKMWGAMVRNRRAEAAEKKETITLAAGVTEADLDAMEKGDDASMTREKVLATAATLGLDEDGTKKFLTQLEAEGVLKVAPPEPTSTNPDNLDLAALPPAVVAMLKAQDSRIKGLEAARLEDKAATRAEAHKASLNLLMSAGKLPPSEEKPYLALFAKMEDTEVDMVLNRLGLQDAEIRFGRQTAPDIRRAPGGTNPEDAAKEAMLNMSAAGFSFVDGKVVDPSTSLAR